MLPWPLPWPSPVPWAQAVFQLSDEVQEVLVRSDRQNHILPCLQRMVPEDDFPCPPECC